VCVCVNRRHLPLGVILRSSGIAYPYCLQFVQAIVRETLRGSHARVGVQASRDLLRLVGPIRGPSHNFLSAAMGK
jgi:hypothetical protein